MWFSLPGSALKTSAAQGHGRLQAPADQLLVAVGEQSESSLQNHAVNRLRLRRRHGRPDGERLVREHESLGPTCCTRDQRWMRPVRPRQPAVARPESFALTVVNGS